MKPQQFNNIIRPFNGNRALLILRRLLLALMISSSAQNIMAQCFAEIDQNATSSDIPVAAILPFCSASGFTVTAGVQSVNGVGPQEQCDDALGADIYVIITANIKGGGSKFRNDIASNIQRYFSNIQYAPSAGSPTLSAIEVLELNPQSAIIFRFRVPLPSSSDLVTTSFTLPFALAPNFFFGDIPWNVWVSAHRPDGLGNPVLPSMPPTMSGPSYDGKLVGTITFTAPFYPIVGSQLASVHFDDMTGFWGGSNFGRILSIMMLSDAAGNPAVLTVDVPDLTLGFFLVNGQAGSVRGTLLMSPGAQVVVPNQGKLFMGFVDMFNCSSQVSRGILIEQGGKIDIENSTFSDAEIGITLRKGSEFASFGLATFSNNYKGIRIDNTGSGGVPNIMANFGPSTVFNNTATLKLPYTGMVPPSTTKGYGIEVLSHPGITLGSGFFNNLNNGVRLVRSSFTTRASFTKIKADAGTSIVHQGWAIWGLGNGAESLDYRTGNIFGSNDKGVYVQNMNTTINQVGVSADQGISLVNCKFKSVMITNLLNQSKALNCRFYAIKSSNSLPLNAGSIIRDNLINMNNPGNNGPTGTGILLGEGSQVTTKNSTGWIIQNNSIDLNRTHWGIRGLGVFNSGFYNNDVEILNNSLSNVIGIDVLNTNRFTANCNDVHTAAVEFNSRGYLFKNVNQSDYICNTTDKLSTGIEFSLGCEGTTLKGSGLGNTPTGLLLRNDVALGTQGLDVINQVQDHGNQWLVSAATHQATQLPLVQMSRFGVDPAENAAFNPPNNWGNNWFILEPTPDVPSFYCAGFPCTPPSQLYVKDRSVETAIANGGIYNVGLPGVVPKILENHLYAELQQNPSWASGNNLFAQFLQSKAGTSTAAFWYIQQGITALNNRTDVEQDVISASEVNVRALRHDLFLMDSTYSEGNAINETQYKQKLASLSTATNSLQAQLNNLRSVRLTQAAQLLTQNTAIATPQLWEQNEKQVNDLELRIFMQDSVTTAQLAQLDAIGSLCPQTYGEAVLRAQVLYNRFIEKEFTPVCTGARGGAGDREGESLAPNTLKIYPNPSSGWVTIPNLNMSKRTIQVFDIAGKLVLQIVSSEVEFDLSALNNGVYLIRIKDEVSGKSDSAKLIVSK